MYKDVLYKVERNYINETVKSKFVLSMEIGDFYGTFRKAELPGGLTEIPAQGICLLFFFFKFYLSIVDLQYCDTFCCTTNGFSYAFYTYPFFDSSTSDPQPSTVSLHHTDLTDLMTKHTLLAASIYHFL